MKKNGFISMSLILSFFLLFVAVMLALLVNYAHARIDVKRVNNEIIDVLEGGSRYGVTMTPQVWTVSKTGTYKIELWAAQGGDCNLTGTSGGYGSYVSGNIKLNKGEVLYLYVGSYPKINREGGYNGGGNVPAYDSYGVSHSGGSGGGATDVRFGTDNLNYRIMVAGAGGGSRNSDVGGAGGGLTGYQGTYADASKATGGAGGSQTAGGTGGYGTNTSGKTGSFGFGADGNVYNSAGGGGYYGGGGSGFAVDSGSSAGGGSSYISGHTGCVAITSASNRAPKSGCTTGTTTNSCSVHFSGKFFSDTTMIDGNGHAWVNGQKQENYTLMPTPQGSYYPEGTGHVGDGYIKISFVNN